LELPLYLPSRFWENEFVVLFFRFLIAGGAAYTNAFARFQQERRCSGSNAREQF
jgi:hypothetical protein